MLLYHLKKPIIPFLDELTAESESTQSVNTLYLKDNKVIGHNTDIIGFETSIKKHNFNFFNKEVLILGAGGVVSSIILALKRMKVSKIKISNRTKRERREFKRTF
jgi:shikimate dehydrogenase